MKKDINISLNSEPWWMTEYLLAKKSGNVKPEILEKESSMEEKDFNKYLTNYLDLHSTFLKPEKPCYKGEWRGYEELSNNDEDGFV